MSISTSELTIDILVDLYGYNKATIQREIRNWTRSGVYEEDCLVFLEAKALGETRFAMNEFSFDLAPKSSVIYNDHFFLTLEDLCDFYSIQASQVKLHIKRGMSFEKAVDQTRMKAHGNASVIPNKVVDWKVDKKLNLNEKSQSIIEKYGLNPRDMLGEANKHGLELNDFLSQLERQINVIETTTENKPFFGEVPKNLRTKFSLEFDKLIEHGLPGVKRKVKGANEKLPYFNTDVLANDAYVSGTSIPKLLKKIKSLDLIHLYLNPEYQPKISFRGVSYQNFEEFTKINRYKKIDLRLRLIATGGNLDEAVKTAKRTDSGSRSRSIVYDGKAYPSMSSLAKHFNINYSALVQKVRGSEVIGATQTVEDVVDELVFNSRNNYITVNNVRVFLNIGGIQYKNVTHMCNVLQLDKYELMKALREGHSLDVACQLSKRDGLLT